MPTLWKLDTPTSVPITRLVVLDRDGVLNVDTGHVSSVDSWVWIPEAREAIAWLNRQGSAVAVATNQAGIAKGLYTEGDFADLMYWVAGELAATAAHIDAVYYCPHHPDLGLGPYRLSCECRKPKPGMLADAMADFSVRPQDCLMVGDSESDAAAADAAGIRSLTYAGGSLLECVREAVARWRQGA